MKAYWRRPFQFWVDYKLAIDNKHLPEPGWFKYVQKQPPGQHNLMGKKPWPKIQFPLDTYRRLYYNDYPTEATEYAHSVLPGESRYIRSPMEIFLDRHWQLTESGVDPDLAYIQCQEEKENREFTSELERYFCAQQAMEVYGVDTYTDPTSTGPSAYEKAKASVEKEHRDRLERIIDMKRDAGTDFKITGEDVQNMSQDEIFNFIRTHPEDARFFDESVYFGESMVSEEFEDEMVPAQEYQFVIDPALNQHFGLGEHWNLTKDASKTIYEVTQQDLEDMQSDTMKMVDQMSVEMGLDLQDDTLYDTLDDEGRFEVLAAWTKAFPDSKQLAENTYYDSQLSQHLKEYSRDIVDPARSTTPKPYQLNDPKFVDDLLGKKFQSFRSTNAQYKTERSNRPPVLDIPHTPFKPKSPGL